VTSTWNRLSQILPFLPGGCFIGLPPGLPALAASPSRTTLCLSGELILDSASAPLPTKLEDPNGKTLLGEPKRSGVGERPWNKSVRLGDDAVA
jgi:hypothetical protein